MTNKKGKKTNTLWESFIQPVECSQCGDVIRYVDGRRWEGFVVCYDCYDSLLSDWKEMHNAKDKTTS